ncbi:hypothetical protein BP5796_12660 [Coleophoma crateriformis]|uniref:Golgi apparatus membrane protein TVP38 n=1 Tax=Coleophoma crateriformis TaxID=565419 RepID=A0A3D8Q6B4_9HELO|nr:hypothetical protein BP5796_12660 [Coleophoma crateriformis]
MNHPTHYAVDGDVYRPQAPLSEAPPYPDYSDAAELPHPDPVYAAPSQPYGSVVPVPSASSEVPLTDRMGTAAQKDSYEQQSRRLSKKWQRRLYWMVPLGIVTIVLAVLFEVYKTDFENWVSPLADWLRARESWSWVIPVAILFILSFPPLFGHEIVQIVVGLTYPLGVAIGIACAGAVLGEAGCFVVFKYGFTSWVEKKIETNIKWAATARIAQEAGFRGVLVIRYSIVPPHLANPLFSCTGMKFWLYMVTVFLSLPKSIVFVALGTGSSENSKAVKWGKVVAIGVVVVITIFASLWIRKKMKIAIAEIKAERYIAQGGEELAMLRPEEHNMYINDTRDTSYHK